jgi:hypothetical protein
MRLADNNDLRNAARAAQEAGDMQTVATLTMLALLPVKDDRERSGNTERETGSMEYQE